METLAGRGPGPRPPLLWLGLLLGLLLVDHHLLAAAFSRDLRSFSFVLDRSRLGQELIIKFDPFLQTFEEAVEEMCSTHVACQLESKEQLQRFVTLLQIEYANSVNENILKIYQQSIFSSSRDGRVSRIARYEWLDQADAITREDTLEIQRSTDELWLLLRHFPGDMDVAMLRELQNLAHKWGAQSYLHSRSTPAQLLEAAVQLFNSKYYEQSFAIASHVYFRQQEEEYQYQGTTTLHSSKDPHTVYRLDVEAKLSLFSLLSELFQLRNDASGSIAFHAKTLLLLSTQVIYDSDANGHAVGSPRRGIDSLSAYLARMRVVLFMPILPSSFEVAIKHRADMIEDIDAITASILAHGVQVPIQRVVDTISATFFRLPHQGLNDRDINLAVTRLYAALCPDFTYTAPRLLSSSPFPLHTTSLAARRVLDFTKVGSADTAAPDRGGHINTKFNKSKKPKYRVAFVSSHFFHHSIGRMLVELMHHMASGATRSDYGHMELFAFYMTDAGPTQVQRQDDELTAIFAGLLQDNFVRVPISDIQQMRRVIGSEQYDLDALIFADVGMELQSVILANSRLAPLQIAWWGHPVTTASAAVDFFFGLDVEVPHAGGGGGLLGHNPSHYSEQLVRLHWMNTAPIVPMSISDRRALFQTSSRSFGIPDNSKHFMILGRLFKIHPIFDNILFDILLNTAPNVFVVVVQESENMELNAELYRRWKVKQDDACCTAAGDGKRNALHSCCGKMHNYKDHFQQQHVMKGNTSSVGGSRNSLDTNFFSDGSYVLHRIRFVHYSHYVKALMTATAVLDTFPYGGCLTTHDALANAVPMITLPLEHVRGRYSIGMYRQMRHEDLVARNASHFASLAVRLAQDEEHRQVQSRHISEKYDSMHRNELAAKEWWEFLDTAIRQLQQ